MENQVVRFNVTDAAIGELKEKFTKIPDVSTKDGYEFVRVGISELVKKRTGLGEHKTKLKAPHLDYNRKVDAEYNRLIGEIEKLETPMKAAKAEEDKKKEIAKEAKRREEEQRKFRINEKINEIREVAFSAVDATPEAIRILLDNVRDMKFTKAEFQEFKNAAEMARIDVKTRLESLYTKAVEAEAEKEARKEEEARLAEEAKELEEERKEIAKEAKKLEAQRLKEGQKLEQEKAKLRVRERALAAEREKDELAKAKVKQEKERKAREAKDRELQASKRKDAVNDLAAVLDRATHSPATNEELANEILEAIVGNEVRNITYGG